MEEVVSYRPKRIRAKFTPQSVHVRQGKQVLESQFWRGQNSRTPVFLLAPITKPMTASAVMILSDRNQLSIDDPVQKFIPEFVVAPRKIAFSFVIS